ncbi:MAG: 50S ribosomal protein L18 [Oscillospiraceae bacterium]|nr:50S ribosomal protein L18 [Oscillospiraceae bacterium]
MIKRPDTNAQRIKRHKRVRGKISGTPEVPRLNVFRSEKHIYAQIIDDVNGNTLCSASTVEKDFEGLGSNKEAAKKVGLKVSERAKDKGIEKVVFDRGGYVYHGRVAALADGAREGGLEF